MTLLFPFIIINTIMPIRYGALVHLTELKQNPRWRKNITPYILSGGKSRRMGENKSFVKLGGKPLIEIVLKKITDSFAREPIIIANYPDEYKYLGCEIIGDIFKDRGPLGGIHTALLHALTHNIFIVACDMPFIESSFIEYMAKRLGPEDVLIPHNGENVEPLHAIYSKNCLPAIELHLHKEHCCVQSFFQDVIIKYITHTEMVCLDLPEYYFLNVNTIEDLNKAKNCI